MWKLNKMKAIVSGAVAVTIREDGTRSVWLSEMREKVATVAITAFREAVRHAAALPAPQSAGEASALEAAINSCHALLQVHLNIITTDRKSTLILPHELVELLHLSGLDCQDGGRAAATLPPILYARHHGLRLPRLQRCL